LIFVGKLKGGSGRLCERKKRALYRRRKERDGPKFGASTLGGELGTLGRRGREKGMGTKRGRSKKHTTGVGKLLIRARRSMSMMQKKRWPRKKDVGIARSGGHYLVLKGGEGHVH